MNERQFEFRTIQSLPRLAWCARVSHDSVTVFAGEWVFAGDGWFVEGAWNGPLTEAKFAEATFLTGSGGLAKSDQLMFCTPSHVFEHLYSARHDGEFVISNSLVFLMTEARIELDYAYPNYIFDVSQARRTGIRSRPHPLPGGVDIHTGVNLVLSPEGDVSYVSKPVSRRPDGYESLFEELSSTMGAVFANAADPARHRPFRPIVALSRGYDSTAIAALASQLGCTEVVTSIDASHPEDCGTPVAAALGMEATEYPRSLPPDLEVHAVAEFLAAAMGVDMPKAVMADQLEGSVLMIGNDGDQLFGLKPGMLSDYRNPTALTGPGASYLEFRLRVGMILFPVPAIVGRHPAAVHAITHLPEMKPWSVGGGYDRPIPRRIAEEAGVPRELFGQHKAATSHVFVHTDGMPAHAAAVFDEWHARMAQPPDTRGRFDHLLRRIQKKWVAWMMGGFKSMPLRVREALRPVVMRPWWRRAHRMWGSRYLYGFHWGADQIRDRYRI